jgi:UrcA family protein
MPATFVQYGTQEETMKTTLYSFALALTLCTGINQPALSQERIGTDEYAVTLLGADMRPATPQAARRMVKRIENAALMVCGATPGALAEVTRAIRRSACWRETMARTIGRIDDPLLAQAYRQIDGS